MIPQNLEDLRNIALAAERLVRCKGRHHSELNMVALAALFGVKLPPPQLAASGSVPPLSTMCPESVILAIDKLGMAAKDCGVALAKSPALYQAALDRWVDARSEALAAVGAGAAELPALTALRAILAEPYGCVFCDSGKLRNPAKPHEADCGFELARIAVLGAVAVDAAPAP